MNICPQCHVDRDVVVEMLRKAWDSDDLWLALSILNSCAQCRTFFKMEQKVGVKA